ncbi:MULTISPECIES: hypothetical protein [unclassified Mesorhizobium]|uniref:hypothetical protein n=1 Tax=unclassified Mesorhizobium TaxID=325217 RepID=UPI0032AFCFFF
MADLTAKMREAQIDAGEMMAFHKVATMLEDSQGRINGDDLIAASFVLLGGPGARVTLRGRLRSFLDQQCEAFFVMAGVSRDCGNSSSLEGAD